MSGPGRSQQSGPAGVWPVPLLMTALALKVPHLTTFALTSQFGWRPEWSRYHLRPVSAGKAVITSSNFKKSYFYSDYINFSAAATVPPANSCTFKRCDSFHSFHVPLYCGLFLLINKTWHRSQFEGCDVCVYLFFLYWQQNEQHTSKDMACVLAGSTWKGVAIPWTIKAWESAAVNRAAEKLWWMCICFAHH